MSKSLLAVTLPLLVAALFSLYKAIGALLRTLNSREVCADHPLAERVELDVPAPGEWVLSLQGRTGSRDFTGLSFVLGDASGREVPSRMIAMRAARTTLSGTVILSVRRFQVAHPGRHVLRVSGLDGRPIADDSRVQMGKAAGGRLLVSILWVVASAVIALAGLVASALLAFSR